jgi:peptidyl-prolyl cis-trans isomerase D
LKSGLGWHLMRVDAITGKPGRSLDQVRGELSTAIAAEKRRNALIEFVNEIENEFADGASLGDVAQKLGVAVTESEPLTASGAVFGKPEAKAPAELGRVLQTAFGMEQGHPEVAEIVPNKSFLIYDLASVTPEAPAPLGEIRQQVITDFGMREGDKAAKATADRALAAAKKGTDLGLALAGSGAAIPPVDQVNLTREELVRAQSQVPAPLRLLFNMAAGTTKILPAPRNRGYYVVQLKTIEVKPVDRADPIATAARRELSQSSGKELAEQLRVAIRGEVGVERNDAAVKALAKTLTGLSGN